jgi:hypothetical protein
LRVLGIFRGSRDRLPDRYGKETRGATVMKQPAEWREKAALYSERARAIEDFDLREQYLELAVRYLEMAEKFDDRTVAEAILNGSVSEAFLTDKGQRS